MNVTSGLMLDNRKEYLKQINATLPAGSFEPNEAIRRNIFTRCPKPALAYICIYASNYVTVVDVNDAKRLFDITVGVGPLDIDINRHAPYAYVTNFFDNTLSLIDLRINETITTIPMGLQPAGVRVTRDGRYVYVVHYGEPVVFVLNAYSLEKVAEIPLPSIGFQLDFTQNGTLAFVTLRNTSQVAVIDLSVNLVVKVLPAGAGTECVSVSPTNRLAMVSNEDGNTLTPINVQLAEPALQNIPTQQGPVGLAFTPCGRWLYCANRYDNTVSLFDTFTHSELTRIPAGQGPYGAELANSGKQLVITNTFESTISIINTRTNQITADVTVGPAPAFLAIL
ncbi:MAG: beta-propeller repeat-containing protein [Bacillota bacterium]|nr:beta-propeller repeat-containing protein [Bacillota bacterium]